jgi:3-deoxy-D-manno-octulosonic acid kinase
VHGGHRRLRGAGIRESLSPGAWSAHDPDLVDHAPDWIFDPAELARRGLLGTSGEGRGTAWFFRFGQAEFVLRHYRRGGLLAPLTGDRYLWTGLRRSRPWREWHLLQELREEAIAAPRPAAVRLHRSGPIYRADLITVRIPGSRTFTAAIRDGRLDEADWAAVGAAIRRCHDAGFEHADLNAANILVDEDRQVWLIDWDRGRRHPRTGRWAPGNLARLRRSLSRKPDLDAAARRHWDRLLEGYGSGGP